MKRSENSLQKSVLLFHFTMWILPTKLGSPGFTFWVSSLSQTKLPCLYSALAVTSSPGPSFSVFLRLGVWFICIVLFSILLTCLKPTLIFCYTSSLALLKSRPLSTPSIQIPTKKSAIHVSCTLANKLAKSAKKTQDTSNCIYCRNDIPVWLILIDQPLMTYHSAFSNRSLYMMF